MNKSVLILIAGFGAASIFSCTTPSITAVDLDNPTAPEGMPYYLPRPYLIVTRNIHYIPTATVGLTQTAAIPNSFDTSSSSSSSGGKGSSTSSSSSSSSSSGGEVEKPKTPKAGKAPIGEQSGSAVNGDSSSSSGGSSSGGSTPSTPQTQVLGPPSITVVPAGPIPDGLVPDEFVTYQVIYVPDLTHRYGLRVKGGSGELRSTLNLVNGWMFTGPGPLYLRNSTTGETIQASSQLIDNLASTAVSALTGGGSSVAKAVTSAAAGAGNKLGEQSGAVGGTAAPIDLTQVIKNYAQMWVYELIVTNGTDGKPLMSWQERPDLELNIDRSVVGLSSAPGGSTPAGAPVTATAPSAADLEAIESKIKALPPIKDGTAGAFTIQSVNIDSKTYLVHVVLATNGKTMAKTFTLYDLSNQLSKRICAFFTAGHISPCNVTFDATRVATYLKEDGSTAPAAPVPAPIATPPPGSNPDTPR
jgi:hypothetical protein